MKAIILGKQKIYEVYRMLQSDASDFGAAVQMAETNLFTALSMYVGQEVPSPAVNIHANGSYGATPEEQAALLRSLGQLTMGSDPQITGTPVLNKTVDVSLVVYYYKVADLFEEVYKRTSYIARSRRDKETKTHLLDMIAMTQDDQSVFAPFLRDASSKLLEALVAFTKQVSGAYLHENVSGIVAPVEGHTYVKGDRVLYQGIVYELTDETSTFTEGIGWESKEAYLYTDDKIEFVTLRPEWVNVNMAQTTDVAIFEALVAYVMARWFTLVFPEEAHFYFAEYERHYASVTRSLNSVNRPLTRRHRMF